MRRVLLILFLALMAAPAFARATYSGVTLDPANEVRPDLLANALGALAQHPKARHDILAVVDFAKPSTQPRLYLIDLKSGAVEAYRTAHGKGSDGGGGLIAARFSNVADSEASSLGAYMTLTPYSGKHGVSLALTGVDPTNSNARSRAIVIHSADYMTPEFIAAHGRPGRSWGCFVVTPQEIGHVVNRLENGALLYAGA